MSFRILDLQRRLREVGRIRIGKQVAAGNGRSRPSKLEVFRLTSRDRSVIDAAAERFGGKVEPWDADGGQQWQVETTSAEMPVVVPPGDMSFSQAYEQWTAGGCRVRCDGRWDHQSDKACHCNPEARDCDIHTRLSVILPDLPGLGVWRLDTSGYYAAVELGGVVDLAAGYADRGQMLPARLRLEQRTVKRLKGDKTETRRFAVPVLDLDVHPMSLAGGTMAAGQLGDGAPSRFQPVPPELDTPPSATVAEQVKGLGSEAKPKRRNAATPIPATGARPRTAAQAAAETPVEPPKLPVRSKPSSTTPAAPSGDAAPATLAESLARIDYPAPKALRRAREIAQQMNLEMPGQFEDIAGDLLQALVEDLGAQMPSATETQRSGSDTAALRNKKMWAMVAEACPNDSDADRDETRKILIKIVSAGRTDSSKELGDDEWDALFLALEDLTEDRIELHLRSTGEWQLRQKPKRTRAANQEA